MNCGSGRGRRGVIYYRLAEAACRSIECSPHTSGGILTSQVFIPLNTPACMHLRERGQTGRDREVEKERVKRKVNIGLERENEGTEG